MKKIYNQSTFEVVRMNNHDIVTLSNHDELGGNGDYAPGLRNVFDPDDAWSKAGY